MTSLAQPPAHPRRLVFLGTPEVAVPPLLALHAAGYDIVRVVTRIDKRRGRGGHASPSPVKAAALELGLPVSHGLAELTEISCDLGVVVAYGKILPEQLLERLPMVNLHFSLLPRWRGAAPVERAILGGDTETGVCVMGVDVALDTGPIYACERVAIRETSSALSLRSELSELGASLLVNTLDAGLADPEPQSGEPIYAHKLAKDDLVLNWDLPARQLHRVIRVGGARTTFRGRLFKIHEARLLDDSEISPGTISGTSVGTGDGILELVSVQPEGKSKMAASAWLNGARPGLHEQFQW
ncbi:MAG: methionyl-tRNA formyltransferase [Acidimicrobiales bacterium]